MRYLIVFVFLFSTSPAFSAWKETGNNLVRFVCQRYDGGEPYNEVIVVEQLSVDTVENWDGSKMITLDGSNFMPSAVDEIEGGDGEENRFRMKIYADSSIIPSEGSKRTKEEIIKDLLSQPASLNDDGERMEYEGVGFRWWYEFGFVSNDERIVFDMDDLRDLEAFLYFGLADGVFRCERPELFPEKIWED